MEKGMYGGCSLFLLYFLLITTNNGQSRTISVSKLWLYANATIKVNSIMVGGKN